MATSLKSNVLQVKGRIGNIISYYSRGKLCHRAVPSHYTDRKSPEQKLQRKLFVNCTQFAVDILDDLNKRVLKRGNKKLTYLQNFIHLNIPAFNKNGEIENYELLNFSYKFLPLPPNMEFSVDPLSTQTILVKWGENKVEEEANPNDRLRVMVINHENLSFIPELTATRKDGGATFQLPSADWDKLHFYAFFFVNYTFKSSPTFYQMIQQPVTLM